MTFKKIEILKNVFSFFNKEGNDNQSNKMQKTRKEGFLFGFEDNKNIEISNALLCDISSADWDDELNPNIKNMIQYYLSSKLDCILIGVFFISDDFNLSKELIRNLLRIHSLNSSLIIAIYSPILNSLKIKTFTEDFIKLNIESEYMNYKEFNIDIFNYQYTSNILEDVSFKEVNEDLSYFSCLLENKRSFERDNMELKSKYELKKLSNINLNCDNFIKEQEKLINLIKMKNSYSKDKLKEFNEMIFKKIGDFSNYEKMDIGIIVSNIKENIKDLERN